MSAVAHTHVAHFYLQLVAEAPDARSCAEGTCLGQNLLELLGILLIELLEVRRVDPGRARPSCVWLVGTVARCRRAKRCTQDAQGETHSSTDDPVCFTSYIINIPVAHGINNNNKHW